MKVIHVVHRDKFTKGYIDFMKTKMTQYKHYFIIQAEQKLDLVDQNNVFYVKSFEKTISNELLALMDESDVIIFSGIFNSIYLLKQLPRRLLKKTYLQFWGADFYSYSEFRSPIHIRYYLHRFMRKRLYNSCAGHIFLIQGEYKKYESIFGKFDRNFVVSMPTDYVKQIVEEICELRQKKNQKTNINIMIGNSATKSNRHEEVLDWLSKYSDKKITIYMPLSYGDPEYRNRIIRIAKEKYGISAVPIVQYMSTLNYIKFLSAMDIGIINCNRQQGMGNILFLLALGKKVYIRRETTMWESYCSKGYTIFDASKIPELTYEQFLHFTSKDKEKNENICDQIFTYEQYIREWNDFFEAIKR